MNPKTDWSIAELYALERAARSARAREVGRMIFAGAAAVGRLAKRIVSHANSGKETSHA